jgi:pimeloyl-[acyl-carrier protein] methyl ester esterase
MLVEQNIDCMMLHGWGVSNTIWHEFAEGMYYFDSVSTPCLYELAKKTKDNKFESIAAELSKMTDSDCVVIAWSIGGLIATRLAALTDKVKAIIFIASTPCFVNKEDWLNTIDRKSINDLQTKLSNNPVTALEYFAGLIAQGDVSSKNTNRKIRQNLADEKHSELLSSWLIQLQQNDQRVEFESLNIPVQVLLGEHDVLVKSQIENQLKLLSPNSQYVILKDCGHAPFISKQEETKKIINEFICARIK